MQGRAAAAAAATLESSSVGVTECTNPLVLFSHFVSLSRCWIAALLTWIFLKIYSSAKMLKSFNISMEMWNLYEKQISAVEYHNMTISMGSSLHWLNKFSNIISVRDWSLKVKHVLFCFSFPSHMQLQAEVDQLSSVPIPFPLSLKIISDKSFPAKGATYIFGIFITVAFLQSLFSSHPAFLQPPVRTRPPCMGASHGSAAVTNYNYMSFIIIII